MTDLSAEAKAILEAGQIGLSPSATTKASVLVGVEANLPGAISAGSSGSFAGAGAGLGSLKLLLAIVLSLGIGGGIWLAKATDGPTTSDGKIKSEIGDGKIKSEVSDNRMESEISVESNVSSERISATTLPAFKPSPSTPEPGLIAQAENTAATHANNEERSAGAGTKALRSLEIETASANRARSAEHKGSVPKRAQKSLKSTLADEQKLIAAAQVAIRRKQFGAALTILTTHKSKFPTGMLTPERDAATAIALCLSGKGGKAGARRFLESHSQSPLASRVRTSCELP